MSKKGGGVGRVPQIINRKFQSVEPAVEKLW